MPQRMIRDWTDSWTMQQLASDEERFFVRLMMKADDFGRFHACPNALKSFLFPLLPDIRTEQVRKWRDKCVDVDLIRLYRDEKNREFLVINKFGQRLRTMKTAFPPPCGHNECKTKTECQHHDGALSASCQQSGSSLSVEEKGTEQKRSEGNRREGNASHTHQEKPKTGSHTPCEIDLPRSVGEVVEHFGKYGAPAWLAEDWFYQMEGCGWVVKGTQIRKWRAVAINKIRWWESDGRPKTQQEKANGKSKPNSQSIDRSEDTANAGLADQYARVGQVAQD